ncbi:MAG TPA: hypothetical protein VE987_17925 [Polyangiaceae bacterium]|nr:hypothetical protein [Polyangiaceae bacterium]
MQAPAMSGNGQRAVLWTHEVRTEGGVTFRSGRESGALVAEWPGLGTLACRPDGTGARFTPCVGAAPDAVGKLRRGQVRALLRDLRGGLALHASAVAVGDGAVLFVGPSGAGKSTAAAALCVGHGGRLLADDAALLDVGASGADVLPCEEDHWLWPDSCAALGVASGVATAPGGKRQVHAPRVAVRRQPLAAVVILRVESSDRASSWRRLRGGEAALALLEAAFRFDVDDAAARRRELDQVTTIYRHVPFVEWTRREGGAAADVAKLALDVLGVAP